MDASLETEQDNIAGDHKSGKTKCQLINNKMLWKISEKRD